MTRIFTVKKLNRNKTKIKTVSQKIKESEKIISMSCVFLIVIMSFLYVFQISRIATNGYKIEDYEQELANLKKDNQKMIVKLADLKDLHNIDNKNNKLVAVEYRNISYVTSSSRAVAIRK